MSSAPDEPANHVLAQELRIERGQEARQKWQAPVSSGVMYTVLQAAGDLDARADSQPTPSPALPSSPGTQGCPNVYSGPVPNIRVNQDCSRRRQAEEVVTANPLNPDNLVAGQNDSRLGFNHCGYDWSFDQGLTWGDQVPPFYQFLGADGTTADACSDPTATFDQHGNVYVAGILFDIATPQSDLIVMKSNYPIGGAFYHSPDSSLSFQEYRDVPVGVIASDFDPDVFNDKEFITADTSAGSPKIDNLYMTWTRFAVTGQGVGGNSPIYFSQSTDGGATWSTGISISGSNRKLCTAFSGSNNPAACDQDQGSHPVVGPDGTIYVAFGNGNTPLLGINQILIVSCPPDEDCTQPGAWTKPVKVNDLIDNHPTGPDPVSGCPAGRQCLPPNGYRVPEFTSITTSVDSLGRLYVTWADFRNGGPPCDTGDATTSVPPCDNDVFYSFSVNGGTAWSPATQITPAGSAQWQPWSDVTASGGALYVGYYDRSYDRCEFTGCNDITLARIGSPAGAATMSYTRITTSSMPNLVVANNPLQAGFLGDYMWVEIDSAGQTHVVWADTRGLNGTVEEDVYYATVPAT